MSYLRGKKIKKEKRGMSGYMLILPNRHLTSDESITLQNMKTLNPNMIIINS